MTRAQKTLPALPGLAALVGGVLLMFAAGWVLDGAAPLYAGLAGYLLGAFWLWLSGWRTVAQGLFFIVTVMALGLKLFTAELAVPGGRDAAVVLKDRPSLASVARPGDGAVLPPYRYVIRPVDGGYVRIRLYRVLVAAGWIAAPLTWLLGVLTWRPIARRFNLHVPPGVRRRRRGRIAGRKRPLKRWLLYAGGYTFLFLGVLGLFLPILQGILFLVIGFLFLARVSPRVRLQRWRLRARYPRWAKRYDGWERRAKDWLKGRFGRKAKGQATAKPPAREAARKEPK